MLVKHKGNIAAGKALSIALEGEAKSTKRDWEFDLSAEEVAKFAAAGAKLALSTALTQSYAKVNEGGLKRKWDDVIALLPTDRPITTTDFASVKATCGVGVEVDMAAVRAAMKAELETQIRLDVYNDMLAAGKKKDAIAFAQKVGLKIPAED